MKVIQSFQSTYWTRRGWAADGEQTSESVLLKYPLRKILLAASVTSWMRFAPECERVLYVDQDNYDVINGWGWISLWDTVKVVNFARKLTGIRYYTASKPYTWALQTEPYWSCDLDCFLIDSLPKTNQNIWYGGKYSKVLKVEEFEKVYNNRQVFESPARFFKRQNCVNTGMLYCPKPSIGRIIGLALLEIDRQLDGESWSEGTRIYRQEAAYSNFLEDLGEVLENIEDGTFYYHKPNNLKDSVELDQQSVDTITTLLGYDPVEKVDSLVKILKPGKSQVI